MIEVELHTSASQIQIPSRIYCNLANNTMLSPSDKDAIGLQPITSRQPTLGSRGGAVGWGTAVQSWMVAGSILNGITLVFLLT